MRSSFRKFQWFVLALGCFFFSDCQNKEAINRPIVIGAFYNASGGQSELDLPSFRGAMLAADQLNQKDGILGSPLYLVLRDGLSDPNVLRQQAIRQFQSNPGTVACIGLSDSDMLLPAAEVAADKQVVFLTSGATSPKLPAQVPDYLFLACFGDNVQAAAAAEFAYQQKNARLVAVVYDSTETYTSLLQGYFVARFEQLGGQILSVQGYNKSDLSPVTAHVRGADLIFLSAMPDGALPAVQLIRNAGYTMPIIGGDGFDSESTWNGQTAISDVFYTTHAYVEADNLDPKVQAFRTAYQDLYGHEPDAFAALGYDTVNLLAQAIDDAQSPDPAAILKALSDIRDFAGVTGRISYLGDSRIPLKSVTIMGIEGGTLNMVMQLLPDQVPPP